MLIRTNFGKTIGAYTHYEWKTEGSYVNDSQRSAFLLQMDAMEKMVPLSDNSLIFRLSSEFTFGEVKSDLYIKSNCNS